MSSSDTVTIAKSYFQILLSKAQHNGDLLDGPAVTVPRAEYDELLRISHQHANLRSSLKKGGVGDDVLALLSGDGTWQEDHQQELQPVHGDGFTHAQPQSNPSTKSPQYRADSAAFTPRSFRGPAHHSLPRLEEQPAWADALPSPDDVSISTPPGVPTERPSQPAGEPVHQFHRPQYERMATRTVLLFNLAEGTTHSDVTQVVRGGQLLDIYMRPHDKSVTVSFLYAADAAKFFEHVQKHGVYIKQKKADIRWADRQFILPGHVANKIGIGATRNLIIRRCDYRLTEENIRDDLEHIHNLAVVRVTFAGGNCFVSTNSVHNAMFARTCLMSRAKYKSSRIEWGEDECCAELPEQPVAKLRRQPSHPPRKPAKAQTVSNRFQLLNIDGDEEEEESADAGIGLQSVGVSV